MYNTVYVYYSIYKQLNSLNTQSMVIIKFLILTVTCNTYEDNENPHHTRIIKLVTTLNCFNYANSKINVLSKS